MKLNPHLDSKDDSGEIQNCLSSSENNLYIHGDALTTTNSFKVLGVTLNSELTFEDHVCSTSSSVAQKTGFIRKF